MPNFQELLVGVDLSHGDWLADLSHDTPSQFACQRAMEVAKAAGARLHFLAALDLDARTQQLLKKTAGMEENVLTEGQQAIDRLIQRAAGQGVEAKGTVAVGKAWKEIVAEANQGSYDLVVLGSRRQTRLGALLLGGTSMHVVQEVTAPVWVVRPGDGVLDQIMVATDFSPVCDSLLERAARLATLFGAELHLAHVVERRAKGFWHFGKESPLTDEEHRRAVEEARGKLDEAAARLTTTNVPHAPQVHIREGIVEEELQGLVDSLGIDLLAMGMVAWGGLQGLMFGSTAQAMLPQLKCSLLTLRGNRGNRDSSS